MRLAIEPRDVHLWVFDPTTQAAEALGAWLSSEERGRAERFAFELDRQLFRCARGLARAALSACTPGVTPNEWVFSFGAHGKPEVAQPPSRLRFNVTHARACVACIVALDVDCGVDVEHVERRANLMRLAEGVLTRRERQALAALPDAERPDRFFRHWTLKEAYAKARGLGLSLPFDGFEVDPTVRPIGLRLYAPADDDASCWQLEQHEVRPHYWLSVAIRRGRAGDYRLLRQGTELTGKSPLPCPRP